MSPDFLGMWAKPGGSSREKKVTVSDPCLQRHKKAHNLLFRLLPTQASLSQILFLAIPKNQLSAKIIILMIISGVNIVV